MKKPLRDASHIRPDRMDRFTIEPSPVGTGKPLREIFAALEKQVASRKPKR